MSDPIRIKILVTKSGDREPLRDSHGDYHHALPDDVSGPAYDVIEMVEAAPMRERVEKLEKALKKIRSVYSGDTHCYIPDLIEEALKP